MDYSRVKDYNVCLASAVEVEYTVSWDGFVNGPEAMNSLLFEVSAQIKAGKKPIVAVFTPK
jgi:hypothetical protein